MDWLKIVSAVMLIGFIIVLFPSAKHMLANSPKGTSNQWMNIALIFGVIVMFILLLVQMV